MGKFSTTGNFHEKRGRVSVDPRLMDTLRTAASVYGLDVQATSGVAARSKGTKNHPGGYAVDIRLVDPSTGQVLPNYQNATSFAAYEKFAQTARVVQQAKYPELNRDFRWGGYFKGGTDPADLMHFDVTPAYAGAMAGGSWNGGVDQAYARAHGITNYNPGLGTPDGRRVVAQITGRLGDPSLVPPADVPSIMPASMPASMAAGRMSDDYLHQAVMAWANGSPSTATAGSGIPMSAQYGERSPGAMGVTSSLGWRDGQPDKADSTFRYDMPAQRTQQAAVDSLARGPGSVSDPRTMAMTAPRVPFPMMQGGPPVSMADTRAEQMMQRPVPSIPAPPNGYVLPSGVRNGPLVAGPTYGWNGVPPPPQQQGNGELVSGDILAAALAPTTLPFTPNISAPMPRPRPAPPQQAGAAGVHVSEINPDGTDKATGIDALRSSIGESPPLPRTLTASLEPPPVPMARPAALSGAATQPSVASAAPVPRQRPLQEQVGNSIPDARSPRPAAQTVRLPSGKSVEVGTYIDAKSGISYSVAAGPGGKAVVTPNRAGPINVGREMNAPTIAGGYIRSQIPQAAAQGYAAIRESDAPEQLGNAAVQAATNLATNAKQSGGSLLSNLSGFGSAFAPIAASLNFGGAPASPSAASFQSGMMGRGQPSALPSTLAGAGRPTVIAPNSYRAVPPSIQPPPVPMPGRPPQLGAIPGMDAALDFTMPPPASLAVPAPSAAKQALIRAGVANPTASPITAVTAPPPAVPKLNRLQQLWEQSPANHIGQFFQGKPVSGGLLAMFNAPTPTSVVGPALPQPSGLARLLGRSLLGASTGARGINSSDASAGSPISQMFRPNTLLPASMNNRRWAGDGY